MVHLYVLACVPVSAHNFAVSTFYFFCVSFLPTCKILSKGGAARIAGPIDSLTRRQREESLERVEEKDGGSGGEAQSDSQAAWRQLHLPPITDCTPGHLDTPNIEIEV